MAPATPKVMLAGETTTQDPGDSSVYHVSFEDMLNAGVLINGDPTVAVTQLEPQLDDADDPVLTVDNELVLSTGRDVQLRAVSGGEDSLGCLYEIAVSVGTNETPAQIKERSFRIRVEQM